MKLHESLICFAVGILLFTVGIVGDIFVWVDYPGLYSQDIMSTIIVYSLVALAGMVIMMIVMKLKDVTTVIVDSFSSSSSTTKEEEENKK